MTHVDTQMISDNRRSVRLAARPQSPEELAGFTYYDCVRGDSHYQIVIGVQGWKLRRNRLGAYYVVPFEESGVEWWPPIEFEIGTTPEQVVEALEAAR